MTHEPIVITGASALTGLGVGRAALMTGLLQVAERETAVERPAHDGRRPVRLADYPSRRCLSARQVRVLDDLAKAVIVTAVDAYEEAQLDRSGPPRDRQGSVTITPYSVIGTVMHAHKECLRGGPGIVSPLHLRNTGFATHLMRVAVQLNLQGVAVAVGTGECSGLDAVLHGRAMLASGAAEMMLVVGGELVFADHLRHLWPPGPRATETAAARMVAPYHLHSAGDRLGQSAAALVLERARDAEARGAGPLLKIHSVASRGGDLATAIEQSVQAALSEAAIAPATIDFVIGAGSGFVAADRCEAHALQRVFSGQLPPITSVKAFTGELLGMTGLVNLALAIEACRRQLLPPAYAGNGTCGTRMLDTLTVGAAAPLRGPTGLVLTRGHQRGAAAAVVQGT